ncbi:MAG: phosphoadenylyl-sulfate reductase [Hyphomicrobiaceae bacterium]
MDLTRLTIDQGRAAPLSPEHALAARFESYSAECLLSVLVRDVFRGGIALVSSFGADAAVLLHMVGRIDPGLPVLFLDTGKHFAETIAYRDRLAATLGLTGIRTVAPAAAALGLRDAGGDLHALAPDACCELRKVEPLAGALAGFRAWITGRKRFQSSSREHLPRIEATPGGFKINPLADWTGADIARYFAAHDLPPHPLAAAGYASIGCAPCTTPVAAGEDVRAGRWRGHLKHECGIHIENGRVVRGGGGPA